MFFRKKNPFILESFLFVCFFALNESWFVVNAPLKATAYAWMSSADQPAGQPDSKLLLDSFSGQTVENKH